MDKVICFHCQSENINKAGFTHNRKQRYYCRDCRRFSRENTEARAKPVDNNKKRGKELPSASHLILKIKALAQKLDRTPTTGDIASLAKNKKGYSLDVYYEVFGSFTVLLKRAKLSLNNKQEFDKDKLIGELKILRLELGRALIARDVQAARKKGKVSSLYHFGRAFGSVPKAIEAADAGRRAFTENEIKAYLKKLQTELKRVPTGKEIASRFVPGKTPSLKEIIRMFGSLGKIKSKN